MKEFDKEMGEFYDSVEKENLVCNEKCIHNIGNTCSIDDWSCRIKLDKLEKQLTEAQAELDVAAGILNSYFNGKPITEEDVASGRFEAMQERYNTAKQKTDALSNQINDLKNRSQRMQRFINRVEKLSTPFNDFSPEMWLGLADHMTVYSNDRIIVTFRCGTEI